MMKILLGGIPLGCDNIGDEAILSCVIGLFRHNFPMVDLTVATGEPAKTEKKFGVKTIPLYGFDPAYPAKNFGWAVKNFDVYVWAGATGLSDYPAMGMTLLEQAQRNNVRTVIWNVGMNNELNPAFFTLGLKKRKLAKLIQFFTRVRLPEIWERHLENKIRRRIGKTVAKCDLAVLRDDESLAELRRSGLFTEAVAGADTAILQQAVADMELPWPSEEMRTKFESFEKPVAVCISAQSPIADLAGFGRWMDRELEQDEQLNFVMIPMNPKTDYNLMRKVQQEMKYHARTLLTDFVEPEEVQNLVGRCKVVISSRLHLMILGLNKLVPVIGIARGSKISTFLNKFNLPTCGSTAEIDYVGLSEYMHHYLIRQNEFKLQAAEVRGRMLIDLQNAEDKLQDALKQFS